MTYVTVFSGGGIGPDIKFEEMIFDHYATLCEVTRHESQQN